MWGCAALDRSLTERALGAFVARVMAGARAEQWGEVRSLATRDALDALERHRSEWSRSHDVLARGLGSGAWALWIGSAQGLRYHLRIDEVTWRPLAPPWRRRSFRLNAFEKLG